MISITGRVIDMFGTPLENVSVISPGQGFTLTDDKGKFEISLPQGERILTFLHRSFKKNTLAIYCDRPIDIEVKMR